MKIIRELEEYIEKEIHDTKSYAMKACEIKSEFPALSHVLYTISTQEDGHQAMLHAEVVKLVEAYRKTHGAPPAEMMAVYEFMHKRHIEKLEEAHRYQDVYKSL